MAIAAKRGLDPLAATASKPAVWCLSPSKQKPAASEHYSSAEVQSFLAMASEAIKCKASCLEQAEAQLAEETARRHAAEVTIANLTRLLQQEREARQNLEEELFSCEQAAKELREEISAYFGSDAGSATPARLPSLPSSSSPEHGLPGLIVRQDSKLQADLAAIQRRLSQVARLRDPAPQPGSPRSPKTPSRLKGLFGFSGSEQSGKAAAEGLVRSQHPEARTPGFSAPHQAGKLGPGGPVNSQDSTIRMSMEGSTEASTAKPIEVDVAAIKPVEGMQDAPPASTGRVKASKAEGKARRKAGSRKSAMSEAHPAE
ncbi:hypothetical protein WJX72_002176 [[Myrmecia] bisecta]|uniref:Uncharacterized protein n=1 Tax=[Myrmecia] bisecta TaxID=41462 RepID=A0AAW1PJA1_9CHLO